jgi:hypothetical protein
MRGQRVQLSLFLIAEWLDGTLPGDRGFDPLGLSRPSDFVQVWC